MFKNLRMNIKLLMVGMEEGFIDFDGLGKIFIF
jgi:hypothetical protein